MRYRKPFTPAQRREVIKEHASFRRHLIVLLETLPPEDSEQTEVLKRYRGCIRSIRAALQHSDSRVPVDEINDNIRVAKLCTAEYFRLRYFGK